MSESEPEKPAELRPTSKLARSTRFILGATFAVGIAAGGAIAGYEMAILGEEQQSFGVVPGKVAEVFGVLYGTVIGTMGGIAIGVGLAK